MVAWPGGLTRSTADIDFRAYVGRSSEELASVVEEICEVPVPPDAVEFDPSSVQVEQIVERGPYPGARVRFWGYVGKARIRVQLDVSFSDVSTPGNEVVDYPTILDMPAPRLRAYPKETVVAEKLEQPDEGFLRPVPHVSHVYFRGPNARPGDRQHLQLPGHTDPVASACGAER